MSRYTETAEDGFNDFEKSVLDLVEKVEKVGYSGAAFLLKKPVDEVMSVYWGAVQLVRDYEDGKLNG